MNRFVALIAAVIFAALSVSSACLAQSSDLISFRLQPERSNSGQIHATFHDQSSERDHDNWSTAFMPSDLIGMEVSSFHASGTRPLRFAIIRDAGRVDCAGSGGNDFASGNCRFTADPGFTHLLISRGIGQPTREQALAMMAVNANRGLIDALVNAHYPTPTINNLVALSALHADGQYIADLARAGYRPGNLQKLIAFKALGITPEWIGGFVRIGYANVPSDGLVQMRALGITPDYIQGFDRIGYRNLPVDKLVELKALGITPEFVRATVVGQKELPPVSEIVDRKMFAKRR
ncbi:MAG: hypothetical protein ACTHJK_06250 [Sphingomicrobium sp.]